MNVFIKDKESNNYYNLFDVSAVNISFNEISDDKDEIDIEVYNKTHHVCVSCIYEKEYSMKKYRDLEYSIKTDCVLKIVGDDVYEVE